MGVSTTGSSRRPRPSWLPPAKAIDIIPLTWAASWNRGAMATSSSGLMLSLLLVEARPCWTSGGYASFAPSGDRNCGRAGRVGE